MFRISRPPPLLSGLGLEEWPRLLRLPRSGFSPPPMVELAWQKETVFNSESVGFVVVASNMYLGLRVSGDLVVEVCEDRLLDLDEVTSTHTVPLNLGIGEVITYRGNFTAHARGGLRGYYLRAVWLGKKISEMPAKYPPRLKTEITAE